MAISNDWTNKSLKIQQIDREQKAYRAGMQNVLMMIAGKGGSPGQPYDPPKEDPKNPWVPAPGKKKLAHGKFFDEYGRITTQDPSVGLTPSGKKIKMPVDKKQQKKNKARHNRLYHGS